MKRIAFLCAASALSLPAVAAGPFGVSMGDPISKFPECQLMPQSANIYRCSSLPNPHAGFQKYYLQAFPETGVCMVKGLSENIVDGGNGFETRRAVEDLQEQLVAKYGPATKKFDFVSESGGLSDPKYWVMTLKDKQREYSVFWEFKPPTETFIAATGITAHALNYSTTLLVLQYDFTNKSRCDKIAKQQGENSL